MIEARQRPPPAPAPGKQGGCVQTVVSLEIGEGTTIEALQERKFKRRCVGLFLCY